MIKKLLPYTKKYLWQTILSPILMAGEVLFELFIPYLMANIVDVGIQNKDMSVVYKNGGLMVLFSLLSLLCGALCARIASVASMGFGSELRQAVFNKVQGFSFSNIDKFNTASLITRMTTDINSIQNSYMMVIRGMIRAPLMLVCSIIMTLKINAKLSTIFIFSIPVIALSFIFISSKSVPRFRKMLKKYDKLNASVQENLIAIRVVKAFVRSKREKDKFKMSNDDLRDSSILAQKLIILNQPINEMVVYLTILAALWFGGKFVAHGTMEIGQLSSFLSYITQILMSLMILSMLLMMYIMSKASIVRVVEVLDEQPDITSEGCDKNLQVKDGSVKFDNVSFKYSTGTGKSVLDNINFEIKSGETIGILGGTGSAKTTLVQLIPRLYDATSGSVIVADHNVKEYDLDNLRNNVAMVLQKNVLFSGTIRENLLWGNENATDEEIIEACKSAQAHDFIMSFPDGYDTMLDQGGTNVSGGQKQRLCIARALLKRPKILILDDSTSAVDTATDAKIREAFSNNFGNVTTIIIAQRISSIENADRIFILDDGKINAIGTHEELLENNEIYKEVYISQLEGKVEE